MRASLIIYTATLVFAFASTAAFAEHQSTSDKDAVIRIESEWAKALVDGNGIWFRRTLARDHKTVFPDGEVWPRDKFVDAVSSGLIPCSKCDIRDIDVRIFGRTAVAISHFDIECRSNGQLFAQKEKWTDVYMKSEDGWKCISSHGCKLTR